MIIGYCGCGEEKKEKLHKIWAESTEKPQQIKNIHDNFGFLDSFVCRLLWLASDAYNHDKSVYVD